MLVFQPDRWKQTTQETVSKARLSLRDSQRSRWVWLRDWWASLHVWRANQQQMQRCLQELEDAGIFAASPDCAALCEHLAVWRRRPIHLIAYPFTRTISGLVIARRDHDAIYFAEQAHPLLGMQSILHEVAHLLLGHVDHSPSLGAGDELTLAEIQYARKRACFDHLREVQAERMAYLLRARWLAVRPPTYALQPGDDADDADRQAWERFTRYLGPLGPEI